MGFDVPAAWRANQPDCGIGQGVLRLGRTSRDRDGNIVGVGDMAAQIAQAFVNVGDALRAAGTDFPRVVKYTIYVTDIDAYLKVAAPITAPFCAHRQSSTLIQVSRLAHPGSDDRSRGDRRRLTPLVDGRRALKAKTAEGIRRFLEGRPILGGEGEGVRATRAPHTPFIMQESCQPLENGRFQRVGRSQGPGTTAQV